MTRMCAASRPSTDRKRSERGRRAASVRGLCNWAAGEVQVDHVVVLFVVKALLVLEAVHELGDPPRASAGPRARAPPIVTAQGTTGGTKRTAPCAAPAPAPTAVNGQKYLKILL